MAEAEAKDKNQGGEASPPARQQSREVSGEDLRKRVQDQEVDRERAAAEKTVKVCPKGRLFLETESVSPEGRGGWYARVPHDHTIDDVLMPQYFGQFQSDQGGLRPGDVIEIEPESALWGVRVRVMAKVPMLSQVKTREIPSSRHSYAVKPPPGVRFEWKGAKARWAIFKGKIEVDAGFDSQDEALSRLEELSREKAT